MNGALPEPKTEVIGYNQTKIRGLVQCPCYVDTCVLIDAFVDKIKNHQIKKNDKPEDQSNKKKMHERIRAARDLFKLYNGPVFLTSPMVVAEFITVATNPKFGLSVSKARDLINKIIEKNNFCLCAPRIDPHTPPMLDVPFFDYAFLIEGKANGGKNPYKMIVKDNVLLTSGSVVGQGQMNISTIEEIVLSRVLYNLFLSAAYQAHATAGRNHLEDLFVVNFARGTTFKCVHFVTSDEELVKRLGYHPYPDIYVFYSIEYVNKRLRR